MSLCCNSSRRQALFLVLAVILVMSCSVFVGKVSAAVSEDGEEGTGSLQSYIDDETGRRKTFDSTKQITVEVTNESEHRADVYWDDGSYGRYVATVEAYGGKTDLNSFQGHAFFVTRHGVRENLYPKEVDGQEDKPLKFYVRKPNQKMVIPEEAAPLSGERLAKNKCTDRYEMCKREAARGGCSGSPGWMIVHCCKSCDEELNASALLDYDTRCSREQLNMTEPAWKPGDLDNLFEKWVTDDEFKQYTPNVVSSPGAKFGGVDGPWIITFDTFLTDYESDQIWEGGKKAGFDRSTDQGQVNEFGEMEKVMSKSRTSNNAWCTRECEEMPGVISATKKIESVTGVPQKNYESFQVLQYHKNQFYRMHHDSSAGKDDTPAGHRIMTFFLYLSDVEEGGATRFSKLGIDITPKKGRALVWPSVKNENPENWDSRMYHEARDVIRGEKRAANHWIHLYDYETPNLW
eukprot:CAMPEP_0116102276 /NCGR_PEP_ID=MMETSP0327-20121206/13258_1 /TAXON_ID=44447 /ORGANISM="Pseudo-nitzschia delicatissima, Strain B596" /LENGTH=461 /DNA_ID=CAMNT_0003594295 /DNA_START=59 /DNA_END=1441 /DNA_ORIENTATION=-